MSKKKTSLAGDAAAKERWLRQLGWAFFGARLILMISLPLEALRGYGDYWNFYSQSSLGVPYLDYWTEFPPLFPLISRGIYLLAGGREQGYTYLLYILFTAAQTITIYLFARLSSRLWSRESCIQRTIIFAALLWGLFYGWAYFDALVVMSILFGLFMLLEGRINSFAFWTAAGILTKWFPVTLLPAAWKKLPKRQILQTGLIILCTVAVLWGGFYLAAPENATASLVSQGRKGSWETFWALLDGNIRTGNFGPDVDRRVPDSVLNIDQRKSAVSPLITLAIFGAAGFFLWSRVTIKRDGQLIALFGLTLVIFFLWSPGYSPQWMLYLLPLILLAFSEREALLSALLLVIISLIEWPLLLSRGMFWTLPYIIILRTGLFILWGVLFYQSAVFEPAQQLGDDDAS